MIKNGRRFDWEQKEIDYLKEHVNSMTYEDIGMKLGVSHSTVRMKALELGLSRPRYVKTVEWTDDRIAYLREHFPTDTLSDISMKINVSIPTIRKKAEELHLQRSEGYSPKNFYRRYVSHYQNITTK